MGCADIFGFPWIFLGVVELRMELIFASFADAGFDFVNGNAFDPFPGALTDGEVAIRTMNDHVRAAFGLSFAEQ